MSAELVCRDYGERPGCLRKADERYTMRFDDIGKPPIYWCAACGPGEHEVKRMLEKAFDEQGFEFLLKFERAIKEQEG